MIVQRNVFHLKFGKAKEAIEIWKEILNITKTSEMTSPEMRLLSDVSGSSYTLVLEMQMKSLMQLNVGNAIWATNEKLQALYEKFIPLCESSTKEFFTIELDL
jgi:hypothetical protein